MIFEYSKSTDGGNNRSNLYMRLTKAALKRLKQGKVGESRLVNEWFTAALVG